VGEDVRQLQIFLNNAGYTVSASGVGSPGNETTYFGTRTRKALARYQADNGISPAIGYFGPMTRAHVNSNNTTATTAPTTTTSSAADESARDFVNDTNRDAVVDLGRRIIQLFVSIGIISPDREEAAFAALELL
jgi:peptidoglycan hydrolase-like protein with peptidoglycan-binding domain